MAQRVRYYRSDRELSRCGRYVDGGGYMSRWYQGLGDGMEWLRLSLDGVRDARVRVYASDRPERDGEQEPAMERRAGDLLLYGVRGRYLRFSVSPAQGLLGYELSFPGNSIDAGLPWTMQGDGTLRRFLGVYQSLYMDLNREFAAFPRRLDPLGLEVLEGLEDWLGAARWVRAAPAQLRGRLLVAASALNRMRGTRRGLEALIRLATGGEGIVVEPFAWKSRVTDPAEREACRRLYGAQASQVTVLLPGAASKAAVDFLEDVLEDFLPVGISCKLVQLEDAAPMDGYCYMDVNARLTEPPPPALDEAVLEELVLE